MTRFLEQLAEQIWDQYGEKVSELCIVLPNRRGGLFLKKHLAKKAGKTIWAPVVYSIEDFLMEISGLQLADNIHLLFQLYEIHKEIEGKEAQPFEEFITWGQQLIQDFNDIDSYLADAENLFGYLSEARALSVWNLDQKPLTDFQKNYLKFYQSLYQYYKKLAAHLLGNRDAYTGLLFRETATNIKELNRKIRWEHILFAGFNALTRAEEIIIDFLVIDGKAKLIWDADQYYLSDPGQEAGTFLRQWVNKWKKTDFKWIGDNFQNGSKKITVTGVPFNIGQVKYCGEILSKLPEHQQSNDDTAVILMDEQLLIPLLNSLPDNIEALNITMGLSLKHSPYYSFFDAVFRMHENLEKFHHNLEGGTVRFYFRDVLKVLQHPILIGISDHQSGSNNFAFERLIEEIKSGNKIFLKKEEIIPSGQSSLELQSNFLDPVFESWKGVPDSLECLKRLIESIRQSLINEKNNFRANQRSSGAEIDLEFLFGFSKVVFQISSLTARYDAVKNFKVLHQLFNRIAESTTLPFYGEPLKGLQVMGMLETRTLDFDTIILVSVNEDLIPSGKTAHSFIPFDIRREFHLPTYHHKNAVYAYHFYRLLQRATNIHLIYNTEPDELGGGEKSRFIKQIQQELPIYNPEIIIEEQVLTTQPVMGHGYPPILIPKDKEVFDALKNKALKGLAPTSLNSYRKCRLQFYFSAIAGIEEVKEAEETIDPQILGSTVHDVLHQLYLPLIGKPLSPDVYKPLIDQIDSLTNTAFEKKYNGSDLAYGKNLLLVNVAKIMIANFLKEEKHQMEMAEEQGALPTIYLLEQYLEKTIEVKSDGDTFQILLKGYVDRVDGFSNRRRIIDYKTGRVETKELKVAEWEDLRDKPEMDKSFQLLTYAYILDNMIGETEIAYEAGLIAMNKIKSGFLALSLPGEMAVIVDRNALNNFETVLMEIVNELFDLKIPFDQTGDLDTCSRCPYINLCGR